MNNFNKMLKSMYVLDGYTGLNIKVIYSIYSLMQSMGLDALTLYSYK